MQRPSMIHRFVAAILLPLHVLTCAPAMTLAQEVPPRKPFDDLPDAWQQPWTPPAPVRTNPALRPHAASRVDSQPVGKSTLSSGMLEEIDGARILQQPLRTRGKLDEAARATLREKLSAYAQRGGPFEYANVELLDDQLAALGDSPVRPSLLLEKAQLLRRKGHFIAAEETYAGLWEQAKNRSDAEGRRIAETALKDYLRLLIGLGRREKIAEILDEVGSRTLGGAVGEAYTQAREALWFFNNRAERNVFCGFSAANAVCVPLGQRPIFPDVHDGEEKRTFIRDGLSLFELRAHSHEAGGNLRIVKRAAESDAIPAPSVIHWKFNHYSAITERNGDRYRVKDPHIGFDGWIAKAALNEQASGYFLLPGDIHVGAGFDEVTDAEAKTVFGRHCVHARDDEGDDCNEGGDSEDCAMATYSFRLLNPGLVIRDTPISHHPPYGPSVNIRLTYDQRSAVIPDNATYSNFGPRWTHSLLSWAEPVESGGLNEPNLRVRIIRGNGAYYEYYYNSTTGTYSTKSGNRPQIVFLPGGSRTRGYALVYPDGWEERFVQADGADAL
jgi:hypothetical protein